MVKKTTALLILISLFFTQHISSQVRNTKKVNKFSVLLNGGGFWSLHDYGFGTTNYNISLQGKYRISKSISTVINTGFNFKRFNELKSASPEYKRDASTKLVLFELSSGINYYRNIQENTEMFLTVNAGYYSERIIFPLHGLVTEFYDAVDDSWSGKFGLNGGLGFEAKLSKNIDWVFQAKYHYIFNPEKDMKFINLNLGLNYNF